MEIIPVERIAKSIFLIRGKKVLLDPNVAKVEDAVDPRRQG